MFKQIKEFKSNIEYFKKLISIYLKFKAINTHTFINLKQLQSKLLEGPQTVFSGYV